jgi:hypothetical protein
VALFTLAKIPSWTPAARRAPGRPACAAQPIRPDSRLFAPINWQNYTFGDKRTAPFPVRDWVMNLTQIV